MAGPLTLAVVMMVGFVTSSAAESRLGEVRGGRDLPEVSTCPPGQYQTHNSHHTRCVDCRSLCFPAMDMFTARNCRRLCPETHDNLMKPLPSPPLLSIGTTSQSPVRLATTKTTPVTADLHEHGLVYYALVILSTVTATTIVSVGIAVLMYKRRAACRQCQGHKEQPDAENPDDPALRMCEFVAPEDLDFDPNQSSLPSNNLVIPGSLITSSF